jgi:hypothetical protein
MANDTILVISDLHVGSTVGLWPGEHPIEGGGIYRANKYQQWLLACWQDLIERVQRIKPSTIVINGDIIQGANFKDGQLITSQISKQVEAAEVLLRPLLDKRRRLFVIRGTEWHEGKSSDHIEGLAKVLGAVPDPDTGQYSRWELYLKSGEEVVHFAHHVGCSSVPWYEATVPLRDTLLQLSELWRFYGADAPNLRMVVRSHRHRMINVKAPPDIQVVVTPAWQLKTAFAHKKATSMVPQIGFVLIERNRLGKLAADGEVYPLARIRVEGGE